MGPAPAIPAKSALRAAALMVVLLAGLGLAPKGARAEGGEASSVPAEASVRVCEAGAGERAAQRVQARYDGIRDLRAGFRQINEAATFAGEPLMSPEPKTGKVVFAKPGKMRWTYQEPEPSVVVSDGSTLWIYDVEGKSITRLEVTSGFLSGAALQFLLGDGQILESFEVTATACDDRQIHLDLIPRSDSTYERLGLVADRETGNIVATSVVDLFGNLTRIEFTDIETNLEPASVTFEMEIPDGVEVIDYARSPTG